MRREEENVNMNFNENGINEILTAQGNRIVPIQNYCMCSSIRLFKYTRIYQIYMYNRNRDQFCGSLHFVVYIGRSLRCKVFKNEALLSTVRLTRLFRKYISFKSSMTYGSLYMALCKYLWKRHTLVKLLVGIYILLEVVNGFINVNVAFIA
jgi:hypothetical protein